MEWVKNWHIFAPLKIVHVVGRADDVSMILDQLYGCVF